MVDDSLVSRRSKRSTAGNRMQAVMAEMSVEELSQDPEEDADFVSKVEEEDVFESDFASTEEEEEEEEAAEKVLQEEERRKKRAERAKTQKFLVAPQIKGLPNAAAEVASPTTPKPKPKPPRGVAFGVTVDAETGQVLQTPQDHGQISLTVQRQSRRETTRLNTQETQSRLKDAESKKVTTVPKKPKEKKRKMTQADLITAALDLEEENTRSHREYLAIEEERRKKARVMKPTTNGPKIRFRSRGENGTVTITEEVQAPPRPPPPTWPTWNIVPGQPGAAYPYHFPPPPQPGQSSASGSSSVPRAYPPYNMPYPPPPTSVSPATTAAVGAVSPAVPNTSNPTTSTPPATTATATAPQPPAQNPVTEKATPTTNGSTSAAELKPSGPSKLASGTTVSTSPIQPITVTSSPVVAAPTPLKQTNGQGMDPPTSTTAAPIADLSTPSTASAPNAVAGPSSQPVPPPNYAYYSSYYYAQPPAQGQAPPYPPYNLYQPYSPASHYGQQARLQLHPTTEKVTRKVVQKQMKNYVEVLLDEERPKEKPTWRQTMDSMFGTHVNWDNLRVYSNKNRPLGRLETTCPITGTKAKYRDPRTGVPFANVGAFRILSRLLAHEYVWSPYGAGQGVFVGHEKQRGAWGVPDRWGQAMGGVPSDWRKNETEPKKEKPVQKGKGKEKDKGKEKEYRVGERRSSRFVANVNESPVSTAAVPMDVDATPQ